MKIGLAQVNPTVADLGGNVKRCAAAVETARRRGFDMLVLPAMAVTGCPARDILFDPSFIDAAWAATIDLAARVRGGPPVIAGTIARAAEATTHHPNLYDAAVLLRSGELTLVGARQALRDDDVYHEKRWFISGPDLPALELDGKEVGVIFDADLEEMPGRFGSADWMACLAASPYARGIPTQRIASARQAGCPVVYANLVGGNDELIFDGHSFILGQHGELLALAPGDRETVIGVDLAQSQPAADNAGEPQAELFSALCLGVRDFLDKNHIQRAFVGISGGVDSAVTTVLACAALGSERVTAVSIPSRHTDPRSVDTSSALCRDLGVGFEVAELEPLHQAAEKAFPDLFAAGTGAGAGPENVQARLRAVILMGYVNRFGGCLLNTTNKTELSVGYITLYGDMAGMLSPLGDLTKLEVFDLAHWINRTFISIPGYILERAPTAELAPGQEDPFDYKTASPALECLVQADQSSPALSRSEFKRRQMGVILRVSQRAFGPGRMIPITRR